MMRLRLLPIMLLTALLGLASCDKQEDLDRSYTDYRYDIVTYLGLNGQGTVFEYLGRGDSAAVRLQAAAAITGENLKPMTRVLLRYEFADARQSGDARQIVAYGCSGIISDSLRCASNFTDWPMHPVKLRSLWRTGEFINLHCQVEFTDKARTFMLVADSLTLSQDTVHCHLTHDLRGQAGTFWRDCYASFNIGAVWKRESCRAVRLHLNDANFKDKDYYDFTKQ